MVTVRSRMKQRRYVVRMGTNVTPDQYSGKANLITVATGETGTSGNQDSGDGLRGRSVPVMSPHGLLIQQLLFVKLAVGRLEQL